MCGRFSAAKTSKLVAQNFEALDGDQTEIAIYNAAPTNPILTISENSDGQRVLLRRKWGLIPSWAKDPTIGGKLFNARLETLAEKASFRDALAYRRCLIPIDGYYEWETTSNGKQPWFITSQDDQGFALAGLYERWLDAEGRPIETTTIITTAATETTAHIHHRRPLVVPPLNWNRWLSHTLFDPTELLAELDTYSPAIKMWPVSKDVGDVRNNNIQLQQPVEPDSQLSFDNFE